MGKITVKHYLHKSTKGGTGIEVGHPVYVQVTVKRQVNRMRSQAEKYHGVSWIELKLKQNEFENILQRNYSGIISGERIKNALALEARIIEDIITFLRPFEREDFSISNFADIYNIATEEIAVTIDNKAKSLLYQPLYDHWFEIHHIINWERSFVEIMEGLKALESNNSTFRLHILDNEVVELLQVAIAHLYTFLSNHYEKHEEYVSDLTFYWFRDDVTRDYLNYLIKHDIIKDNQRNTLEACFDEFAEQTISDLMDFSKRL